MDEVVIKKKDIDRLAKVLLKEVFDFFHDEYIINNFKEIMTQKPKFLTNLVSNHIGTLLRQSKITEEQRKELVKPLLNKIIDGKFISRDEEYFSKVLKDAMKDDGIDTEGIYHTINNLFLDIMEIDGDLYFKKESFLDIFRVFDNGYTYLLKKPTDSKISYLLRDPTDTPLSQIIKD